MNNVIAAAKKAMNKQMLLPFSIYSAYQEQKISNVQILKPLLIFILKGKKELGKNNTVDCLAGTFVFLSNSQKVNLRNIPMQEEYFALLIEFEHQDFEGLPKKSAPSPQYVQGEINSVIEAALLQYIEFSFIAPAKVMAHRKREILDILYYSGYTDVCNINEPPSVSEKVHSMIANQLSFDCPLI